jgi:S1-C subfamily serine protease
MLSPRSLERLAEIYQGIPILGSLPGTPAAHHGLRYGDILVKVNDIRTAKVTDFFRARALDGEHMRVEFVRDGTHITLTLPLANGRRPRLEDVKSYLQPLRRERSEDPPPS